MKKLVSLVIIGSWMMSAVCLYAQAMCEGMDCCGSVTLDNHSSLRAIHCNMPSCAMTSVPQNIQLKRAEALSPQRGVFVSDLLAPEKKAFDFSENVLLISSYQQRIRDGCQTYLKLQHFLI